MEANWVRLIFVSYFFSSFRYLRFSILVHAALKRRNTEWLQLRHSFALNATHILSRSRDENRSEEKCYTRNSRQHPLFNSP